jgi:hypothetical protein
MYCALFGINEFHPQSNKTDLSQALKFYSSTQKKRKRCVRNFDFMSDAYDQTLKSLQKKTYDIHWNKSLRHQRNKKYTQIGDSTPCNPVTPRRSTIGWHRFSQCALITKHWNQLITLKETFVNQVLGVVNTRVDEGLCNQVIRLF